MKKFLLMAAIVLFVSSTANAQIQLGLGFCAPVVGAKIATQAHIDGNIIRVDKTLDASPQILIEVHKTFKANKLGIGPMIGFAPKIDFGVSSNLETEQPLGAGFGMLVAVPAGKKHFINFGAMWLITRPVAQLAPQFKDGFQAPRDRFDLSIPPSYVTASVNRLVLTMTVSGLF